MSRKNNSGKGAGRGKSYEHGATRGGGREREYTAYWNMLQRCGNSRSTGYANYGGRGITVCERWLGPGGYGRFRDDMGPSPSERHTLDRINVDLGYAPENCRWADWTQQGRNRRNNHVLKLGADSDPMSAWAERTGINVKTLSSRLNQYEWDPERALTEPVRPIRRAA